MVLLKDKNMEKNFVKKNNLLRRGPDTNTDVPSSCST